MVYWRYGNPQCPYLFKTGDHPRGEMMRAYYRNPETRVFEGIGWYCDHCHQVWVDGDDALIKSYS
jgi:hypothetical protein